MCARIGAAICVLHLLQLMAIWRQQGRRNSRSEQPSYRDSGPEASVAATVQLLGWESYAFDERRRLDKRGHLQALVVEVNGKIKRTVSNVPLRDQTIFDP